MNYVDRCRNVCHRECANEAGRNSDFDDTFLYCFNECKKKDETSQKEHQKLSNNNTATTKTGGRTATRKTVAVTATVI